MTLQESHQSAEQLKQQFMQSKTQGHSQVREHVIHQQGAQQHATMNGYTTQHGE